MHAICQYILTGGDLPVTAMHTLVPVVGEQHLQQAYLASKIRSGYGKYIPLATNNLKQLISINCTVTVECG